MNKRLQIIPLPVSPLFVVAAMLVISSALLAHHGTAIYDETKPVMVQGVVTGWLWANPHCLLDIDVKNEKGQTVHWTAEVSNTVDMVARGWSRKMFQTGDEVTVWMAIAKNGDPIGRVARILVRGKTYEGPGHFPEDAYKAAQNSKKE